MKKPEPSTFSAIPYIYSRRERCRPPSLCVFPRLSAVLGEAGEASGHNLPSTLGIWLTFCSKGVERLRSDKYPSEGRRFFRNCHLYRRASVDQCEKSLWELQSSPRPTERHLQMKGHRRVKTVEQTWKKRLVMKAH